MISGGRGEGDGTGGALDRRYLRPDGRPLRLSLGLRPLDLEEWLEVDESYRAEVAEKARLLAERHDEVVAVMAAGDQAAREAALLVQEWVRIHHPALASPPSQRAHPLEVAARLVQEDLCVLTAGPQGYLLTAAVVCFPSRWHLRDKMGATVAGIHGPVPGYEQIGPVVDLTLARLQEGRPLWRANWTIVDDPALFLPTGHHDYGAAVDIADLVFRVERQTLRRLPGTGAVLFTIRTYRAPLHRVAASPESARRLADSLQTASPELVRYKGWSDLMPPLLGWLGRRTRHAGSAAS